MIQFRKLKANEIDVRVGGITQGKGGFLLLYKDARCDMNILDETLGITGWQRGHELIDGQLFCNVLIWDDGKGQWIKKQDVGIESNSDAEKGRASDSFKRACVNAGIGRELYTAPFIWINDTKASKDNWKYKKFRVSHITYDDNGVIEELIIDENINYNWQEIFSTKRVKKPNNNQENKQIKAPNNQVKNTRQQLKDDKPKLSAAMQNLQMIVKEKNISTEDLLHYTMIAKGDDNLATATDEQVMEIIEIIVGMEQMAMQ